jgi:hypothetical protein
MNSSLVTADRVTHLKIISLALVAATALVWVGISARIGASASLPRPQLERSMLTPPAQIAGRVAAGQT